MASPSRSNFRPQFVLAAEAAHSDPSSSQTQWRSSSRPLSPHPRPGSAALDQSWDQVVSARNPSQRQQASADGRSLWQQWTDAIQAAIVDAAYANVDDDGASPAASDSVARLNGYDAGNDDSSQQIAAMYLAELLQHSRSSTLPTSPSSLNGRHRDGIPPLAYPQSGQRPIGSDAEEAASNKALEKAGRKAFGSSPLVANRKARLSPLSPPGLVVGGSSHNNDRLSRNAVDQPPSILQRLQQQQGGTGPRNDPASPTSSLSPPAQVPFIPGNDDSSPQPTYPLPGSGDTADALAILLPLLVLLSTLLLLLLLFLFLLIFVRRRARIALSSGDGPLDVGREEELEGAGGLEGVEERWLETVDDSTRRGYARAKDWLLSHPPASIPSEITISQFLSIQEKGVSAWSFEPDYEANSSCYVEARTEITFLADGEGMAPQEGGGCSVQSNLPLPKINEVYYWEAKMFTKPESTNVAVGLATKPYPSFRLPGWSKYSVGFFSQDGFKCHNYPFAAQSYGPPYVQGDVIGVGYRPRTGTVFFTRNGKKFEDAYVGLHRYNLFPTIGSDGPAEVHVNLGQAGFVFLEANVKKWGLAPMVGTLAPPPAYGQERGSILIEASVASGEQQGQSSRRGVHTGGLQPYSLIDGRGDTPPPPPTPPAEEEPPIPSTSRGSASTSTSGRSSRRRRHHNSHATQSPTSSGSSSLQRTPASSRQQSLSLAVPVPTSPRSRQRTLSSASSTDGAPLNPPTPGHLDISLHSLKSSNAAGHHSLQAERDDEGDETARATPVSSNGSSGSQRDSGHSRQHSSGSYFPEPRNSTPSPSLPQRLSSRTSSSRASGIVSPSPSYHGSSNARPPQRGPSSSPPPYTEHTDDAEDETSSSSTLNQARRSSGRTHRLANSALGGGRSSVPPTTNSPGSTSAIGVDGVEGEQGDAARAAASATWGEALSGWWNSNGPSGRS